VYVPASASLYTVASSPRGYRCRRVTGCISCIHCGTGPVTEAVDLALAHFSGESRHLADALRETLVAEGCPWPAGMPDGSAST